MSGAGYQFPGGAKAIAADATQDWSFIHTPDGKLVARPEGEFTWRDEEEGIQLYVLISPSGRGAKLDTLNRSGLVVVEIKERFLRITVMDVMHKVTYRYQWLNLWGDVIPEKSRFHLSQDNKRIVVWLQKKYSNREGGDWLDILDVRKGKYNRSVTGWPGVLLEVQGAWRSEDEEPIEVIGDQVVWPEGSRDLLIVDEETEAFRLVQTGDGDQVPREEFLGVYERHAHRLKWEDGDYWTRIPGVAVKRQDAGKDLLSLEYDATLARWVPWLPPDELRRQTTHWMPPSSTEVSMQVTLQDVDGAEMKQELLESVEDGPDMVIADFDYLPLQLVLKCRVCALAAAELEASLVETMLALRDHRRVSLASEAAGLGGLERWLQWLRPWLAPGKRTNVDGALAALKERLFEVAKDERRLAPGPRTAARDRLGGSYDRWPPLWTCVMAKPNDLLAAATQELLKELREARAAAGQVGADPKVAFAEARRRIGERLFDNHKVEAGKRRCDPLERRWVRRYGEEASKGLLDTKNSRQHRQELRELGLAVVEDALDWGTLVKIHGEVAYLFAEPSAEDANTPLHISAARGGHVRWAKVWTSKLEELGMTGLAAATAFMQQLTYRLSEWEFGKCRWRAPDDPVLWFDDGEPLKPGQQPALEWVMPNEEGSQPHEEAVEDESVDQVPAERRIVAFLFLNTPAWVPEWGGALRCHLQRQQVHRDVWGDGGRLVLLRDIQRHELLPSSHSHAVLILRLQGTSTVATPLPVQEPDRTPTVPEIENFGPDAEHRSMLRRRAAQALEVPDSYNGSLSDGEVRALAESVGAEAPQSQASPQADVDSNEGETSLPKQGCQPPKLKLDSYQVIRLFEDSFPAAFKLD